MKKYKYDKSFTYDGKRYRVYADTKEELYRKLGEKKAKLEQNEIKESDVLFCEYAARWLEIFKKPYVKKDACDMYRFSIKTINVDIGHKKLKNISSTDIQSLVTALYEQGYSKSKIDKVILTLKQIFKRAELDRKIKVNPCLEIVRPSFESKQLRALTDEEYDFFLKMCEKSKYGLWIKFHLLMGLRPEEVAGIKHEDINGGYLRVTVSKTPKGKRLVPIPDSIRIPGGKGYLFTTAEDYPLSRQAVQRWWRYFKRECDIELGAKLYRNKIVESKFPEDITLYTLRRTFATRMSSKVSIDILADLMGHQDINVTRQFYINANMDNLELARQKMNT